MITELTQFSIPDAEVRRVLEVHEVLLGGRLVVRVVRLQQREGLSPPPPGVLPPSVPLPVVGGAGVAGVLDRHSGGAVESVLRRRGRKEVGVSVSKGKGDACSSRDRKLMGL